MITNEDKLRYINFNQHQLDNALVQACGYNEFETYIYGNLDIVKYLLTSPELKEHADIHAKNDSALQHACEYGYLNIVKYLLTSPDLKEHADIHAQDDNALTIACAYGHLELVKYLLTSPDLKEHANIHSYKDNSFINTCINQKLNIIQYLIFDYHIEKTNHIEQYLIENKKDDVLNMFDKRQLREELENTLINNKLTNANKKI